MTKKTNSIRAESRPSFDRKLTETSETDASFSRPQKEITVTVDRIENIDSCKIKEIMMKIEYAGNVLSESQQIAVEGNTVTIDLEAFINAEDVTPEFVDEILANPVLFTVLNCSLPPPPANAPPVSQSSKLDNPKKKPPKTTASTMTAVSTSNISVLGVCNMDLSGLIMGKLAVRSTLALGQDKKLLPEEIITWPKLPRLVVTATCGDEPLISDSLMKCNNIIGVTMECMYNIPEFIKEGTLFDATIPVPSLGEKNNSLLFPNGVTTPFKDPSCKKKWMNLLHMEGQGGKSEYSISPNACDIINTIPEIRDLGKELTRVQPVVQWNIWRNSLMLKSDCNYFYSKLMKYRVWPVEIFYGNKPSVNMTAQKSAKSEKKSKPTASASPASPEHFTAFLDISPLLYPGVTNARIASQLYTYSQSDLVNKFGADLSAPLPQTSTEKVKSRAAIDKSKASVREPEEIKDGPGVPVVNEWGSPTFIIVEVELFKPLTPKKDPELLSEELKSYISLKGKVDKKTMTLALAQENYSKTIKEVISVLVGEYQNYSLSFKKNDDEMEDFDVSFHEFLCQKENFHKIKSTLESKVLQLVNEKYGALSQYNERIPEIFVYLVSEMHKITNRCILGAKDVSTTSCSTGELQLYAEEALEEGEYCIAKDFIMLKLSRNLANPHYWFDCAVFFIGLNNDEAALEAAREGLSLDPNHQIGLLIYGLLKAKFNEGYIAELAFLVLLSKYPDFVEGWMALQLFYTTVNNYEGAYIAQQTALKIEHERKISESPEERKSVDCSGDFCCKTYPPENKYSLFGEEKYGIASFTKGRSLTDPLSWSTLFCPPDNINIRTTVLMLRLGFYEYASMSLAKEMITDEEDSPSPHYLYYHSVNHYLQGRYDDAIPYLEAFVKDYGKDSLIWSLMGHCLYKLENNVNAIASYEYVMESYNRPKDLHLIYLRIGIFYLKTKKYPCAKKVFLIACKYSPSPRLWKGAGIACLRNGRHDPHPIHLYQMAVGAWLFDKYVSIGNSFPRQMQEAENAETAFSEACYLDNKDPETWAYLALTNVLLGRLQLFKHCYSEAKKRNLANEELVQEIQSCILLNGLEGEDL